MLGLLYDQSSGDDRSNLMRAVKITSENPAYITEAEYLESEKIAEA